MSVFVKICGVRSSDDLKACIDAGADAIGFNFWPRSKRHLSFAQASMLVEQSPPSLERFGVFVNAPRADIEQAFALGLIHVAQLHGDESPDEARLFAGRYLKAIRLRDSSSLELARRFDCPRLLVDADAPGYGGSGRRADWSLARAVAAERPVLLAGGLTPDNVAEAIRQVRPFGVDVAGGVERAPGVKDPLKVAAFVAAARGAVL